MSCELKNSQKCLFSGIMTSDFLLKNLTNMNQNFKVYEMIEDVLKKQTFSEKGDFIIEDGDSKIILSAPHAVEQLRNGKIKASENRTATIVMLLRRILLCPIIYKTKNQNDDANYDEISNYRIRLLEYINEKGIQCLFDFHISASTRPYCVDIGTGYGKNICGRTDLLEIIVDELENVYPKVVVDEVFPASNPNTVSATAGRQGGIPAFQVEINWDIISDYEKMLIFVNCFTNIIKRLENEI